MHQHEAAEMTSLRAELAQARDDTTRLAREHAREVTFVVPRVYFVLHFVVLCSSVH